jgi:predicted GTPase
VTGKSSLCNALFGKDAFKVSDVEACTRDPQSLLLSLGEEKGLTLLDVPGLGESVLRDGEYRKLYKKLLPELDALIWVLKADERAFSVDEDFYLSTVKPYIKKGMPFLIALNQVDKIAPLKEWQESGCKPGPKQEENIRLKRENVANQFQIDPKQVIAVSAEEKYGLRELIDKMLLSLPDVKRVSIFKEIPYEYRSAKGEEAVREGILNELSLAAGLSGAAKGAVTGAIIGSFVPLVGTGVGAIIGGIAGGIMGIFKRRR